MKEMVDVIFCVLTYKNYEDLMEFLDSVKEKCQFSYKVIVINSYFDDETKLKIEEIANQNDCVFLNVPNKGYGVGNNAGIEYAVSNFDYKYLIVSNPDILIEKFSLNALNPVQDQTCLIAPMIIRKDGRKQNPTIIRNNRLANKLMYYGFKVRNKFWVYSGVIINKISKAFSLRIKKPLKVFQCHGSFVIFTNQAVKALFPIYDEKIFMFCEEMDLGYRTTNLSINNYYFPQIRVYHKEDGSIKLSNLNTFEMQAKSFIYCYDKWKNF